MDTMLLKLPEVKAETERRPTACRYCGCQVLQGWGRCRKPVRDSQLREVQARRYRCTGCERTFRHYPEGISQADQSTRMVQLAALMWALGLSLRQATMILAAFGVTLQRMSIWRDAQVIAARLGACRRGQIVPCIGVDGTWVSLKGRKQGLVVAVDMGNGLPLALGVVEEKEPQAVAEWLNDLVQAVGAEVLVTDDLGGHRSVARRLGLDHQICYFHMRRWVARRLRQLRRLVDSEWHWLLDEVTAILQQMPADGAQRLYTLWLTIPARHPGAGETPTPLWRLRELLMRLSNSWRAYRLYRQRPGVPATNNRTEQAIGRLKIRIHAARGFKSTHGLQSMFLLCGG